VRVQAMRWEGHGWDPKGPALIHRAPRGAPTATATGWWNAGFAYAQRSGAAVAIVAKVEMARRSCKIWAKKFTVAHDCGLIINLDGFPRLAVDREAVLMRGPAVHTASSKRDVRVRDRR